MDSTSSIFFKKNNRGNHFVKHFLKLHQRSAFQTKSLPKSFKEERKSCQKTPVIFEIACDSRPVIRKILLLVQYDGGRVYCSCKNQAHRVVFGKIVRFPLPSPRKRGHCLWFCQIKNRGAYL